MATLPLKWSILLLVCCGQKDLAQMPFTFDVKSLLMVEKVLLIRKNHSRQKVYFQIFICLSGTLPITLPACWRPPLTFLHGHGCVCRVTVTSVVPRTSRMIGDRAVSVAAPRAWNRLPTDLKLLRSTASFKSKLKSFLFHAAYSGNTVWTLQGAIGLLVRGTLQVTVVTITVNIMMSFCNLFMERPSWHGGPPLAKYVYLTHNMRQMPTFRSNAFCRNLWWA